MKILFASQNKNKQNEARALFKDLQVELVYPDSFPELENFDPEETGATFKENALLKAKAYAQKINIPCIADDSGVIIDGMDGLPGIHSNRWFSGTDDDRNAEVLRRLLEKNQGKNSPTSFVPTTTSNKKGQDQNTKPRTARYITVSCYYDPSSEEYAMYKGIQEGSIAQESYEGEGFAYDKIFIPEGQTETFSVLGDDFKNQDSQRTKAYKKLQEYLKEKLALKK